MKPQDLSLVFSLIKEVELAAMGDSGGHPCAAEFTAVCLAGHCRAAGSQLKLSSLTRAVCAPRLDRAPWTRSPPRCAHVNEMEIQVSPGLQGFYAQPALNTESHWLQYFRVKPALEFGDAGQDAVSEVRHCPYSQELGRGMK